MTDFILRLIIGLVSAVVGAFAGLFFRESLDLFKSRSGELSGEWDQLIDDKDEGVLKKDKVKCSHYGNRLKGSIERAEPTAQKYKKWRFEGYFLDDLFFGTFQTTDKRRNPGSYGTLQLRKTIINSEVTLQGFYVKSDTQIGSRKGDLERKIKATPLIWKR